jgi:3-phosphoshikimate 1-carboxyvinyltransferase
VRWIVRRSTIDGSTTVPGDKSIAHRSLIFAALADGRSQIRRLPAGQDVQSTARVLRGLGVSIEQRDNTTVVESDGRLRAPTEPLDCGNSGTTMRLMTGILAGQPFASELVGDESLSRRPMRRVVDPLALMGAHIETAEGHAPLRIRGGGLTGISYDLPVASAQVKSAVLLAGLFADGRTTVRESLDLGRSRDHTERMLAALGVHIDVESDSAGWTATIEGGSRPAPLELAVPGDPSSAGFLLAAAAMTGGSVRVDHLLTNPSRLGLARILKFAGMSIDIEGAAETIGEPTGAVCANGRPSATPTLDIRDVPSLVDEIPLLALIATQIDGRSEIRGVQELRVKETDRIATTVQELTKLGAHIEELPDGFVIEGGTPLRGAVVSGHGDHRIAMMLAVAGMAAEGETVIEGAESAAVSWPEFAETMRAVGASIVVE